MAKTRKHELFNLTVLAIIAGTFCVSELQIRKLFGVTL